MLGRNTLTRAPLGKTWGGGSLARLGRPKGGQKTAAWKEAPKTPASPPSKPGRTGSVTGRVFIRLGHALEGAVCGSSLSGHVCGRRAPGRGRVSRAVCPARNQATGLGLSFLEASGWASTLLLTNEAAERVRPRRQGSSRDHT